MERNNNTVELYVDKDLVNVFKAGLVLYEALRDWIEYQDEWGNFVPPDARQALAQAKSKPSPWGQTRGGVEL